jgi:hypothetical protein
MDQQTYIITFEDVSAADASRYAEELRDALLDTSPDSIKVERRRADPSTQDFGSALVLILGTPAVVAVARAIGDWLKLRGSASLTITTSKGHIIAEKIKSKDASRLIELFLSQK